MLAKKLKKWYTNHKEYNMLGNLLLRTEYSFMQSLCALKDVVNRSKDAGYEALAIVDFGNLHGGYKFYKEIAENAIMHLNDHGVLILECGIGQAECIKSMLNAFSSVEVIKDYENIDRIVKAVR